MSSFQHPPHDHHPSLPLLCGGLKSRFQRRNPELLEPQRLIAAPGHVIGHAGATPVRGRFTSRIGPGAHDDPIDGVGLPDDKSGVKRLIHARKAGMPCKRRSSAPPTRRARPRSGSTVTVSPWRIKGAMLKPGATKRNGASRSNTARSNSVRTGPESVLLDPANARRRQGLYLTATNIWRRTDSPAKHSTSAGKMCQ